MRVLFLLSCLEPSGSETYCLSLAQAWQGRHDVFWISDRLHFSQTYTSMPIHRKMVPGFLNAFRVASFIRQNKIQLVHSHSRRAHGVAAQAALMTGIPHVTTIHQPPPVHLFSRMLPFLGDMTIAIDEAVAEHLTKRFSRPASKIRLIRNGIDLARYVPSTKQPSPVRRILMIGRLTGGRWNTFQFFLDTLQKCSKGLPPTEFRIVGRVAEEKRAELTRQLSIVTSTVAPTRVILHGFVKDLVSDLRDADGIIAGGRSAMEGMACGKSVLLMGEGGVLGVAKPALWPMALRSNLGDHLEPKQFSPQVLEAGLRELITDPRAGQANAWNREQIERSFNSATVAAEVDRMYRSLVS